jgi:hypothetical protein
MEGEGKRARQWRGRESVFETERCRKAEIMSAIK